MADGPAVALIDDGELADVRALLDELGAEYAHWTKARVPAYGREPQQLLVTTSGLAASLGYRRLPGRKLERAVWIAVCGSDSRSQRNLLLESGFDYLMHRPFHPSALRMLLQYALFRGEDARRASRVAVGYRVSFRVGLLRRPATLVDLSPGGCRLISKHSAKRSSKISILFPAALAKSPFSHTGKVVRATAATLEGGHSGETALGVRFDRYDADTKAKMLQLLNTLCSGPAKLPPGAPAQDESSKTRRARGRYEVDVPIFGMQGYVLVGRDLSPGGLRVDPHPALTMGARVQLVIGDPDTQDNIVVDAEVIRDDGESGVALRFAGLDAGQETRLARIVESLPELQRPGLAEQAERVVLAQILPTLLRNGKRS